MTPDTALAHSIRQDLTQFAGILRTNGHNWDVMGLNSRFNPDNTLSLAQVKEYWRIFLAGKKTGDPAAKNIDFYVNIPFCRSICSYCHFHSSTPRKGEIGGYVDNLLWNFKFFSPVFKGFAFRNLYIGGGTPSLLSEHQLKQLLDGLFKNFSFSHTGQKTFESNPGSACSSHFRTLKEFGFTSVSFGVQSLRPSVLRLNNRHYKDSESVLTAIARAKKAGFGDINADLIAGLAGDDVDGFKQSFTRLSKFLPHNIVVYGLLPGNRYLAEKLKMSSSYYFTRYYPALIKKLLPFMREFSEKAGYTTDLLEPFKWHWGFRRHGQASPDPKTNYSGEHCVCVFGVGLFSMSSIPKILQYRQTMLPAKTNPSAKTHKARRYTPREAMLGFIINKFDQGSRISTAEFSQTFGITLDAAFPYALRALTFLKVLDRQPEFYVFNFARCEHKYIYTLFFFREQGHTVTDTARGPR